MLRILLACTNAGAMDIISCAQLLQLAQFGLPHYVNGPVVLFSLLECLNASSR